MRAGENGTGQRMINNLERRPDRTVDADPEGVLPELESGQKSDQIARTLDGLELLGNFATIELRNPIRTIRGPHLHQHVASTDGVRPT